MAEGEKKQQQRSTSRSRDEGKADEPKPESQDPQGDAPAADEPQGAQTPPPPPTENEEAPAAGETYSKDLLISRAPRLLGYSSVIARGVLAEADENLTIEQAKARIQQFLDAPVANEEG